jgi:cellulose synthase operon protein C
MRLACENCAAVYLIDDGAMTPRGLRAQCPRCKNIQFVPPPPEPGVPEAVARVRAMANPISVSRPPVPGREPEGEGDGKSQVARVALTTRVVARPPVPPPEALVSEGVEARAELFGELQWSDGEAVEGAGPPVPASAATGGAAPAKLPPLPEAPSPSPAAPRLAESDFSLESLFGEGDSGDARLTPGPAAPVHEPRPGTCASCDGALATLDDVASGVCAACRAAAAARLAPPPPVSSPPRAAVPRSTPAHGLVLRTRPAFRSWGAVAGVVAVLLLGGAAMLWLRVRGGKPLAHASLRKSRSPELAAPLPTGLSERLAAWRTANPGERPRAAAALVEAQREMALDRPATYASAERRLEAALVDAPRDPELLGTWLGAVALGRGATLEAGEYRALVALAEALVPWSDRAPTVLVGLAELLLVAPAGTERARALAQEALASDGPHAVRAHLVLAQTSVANSGNLALAELQRAEQLDSTQRRIPVLRAAAHTVNGDPREALSALQARLALEPDHAASLFAMGGLLVDVGESEQARRLFERLQAEARTQDGPALLALAALEAQVQGRPKEAIQLLHGALKRERLTAPARVRANVLLAAAARAAGDAEAAAAAARTALALDATDPSAHLLLLLLALDRADGTGAAEQLPAVVGHLGDPGLEGLAEGRVRLAQGQPAAAAEAFGRTVKLDPRRTDALLWEAAAQATVPDRVQALAVASTAMEADPSRAGPWAPLATVSPRPEEWLHGAEGRLARLSQSDVDVPPQLDEAVLRFHRRDFAGAELALGRVLRVDASQPLALAWRALVLLERGDVKGAADAAAAAQQMGRALPLVSYAAGVTALATGDLDAARRLLRDALQAQPTLLAAQVKLAEVEVRAGAASAARDRLRKVVQIDPSYAAAKRALYLLPKEN